MATELWGADAQKKVAELGAAMAEQYKGTGVDERTLQETLSNPVLIPILKHFEQSIKGSQGDSTIPGQTQFGQQMQNDVEIVNKYNAVFKRHQEGDPTAKAELDALNLDPKVGMAIERHYTGKK